MPDSDPEERSRVTLPKNLPESLKRLEDAELETLLREVAAEADRRTAAKATKTVSAPQAVPAAKLQTKRATSLDALANPPAGSKPHQGISFSRHEAATDRPHVSAPAIGREPGLGPTGKVKEVTVFPFD